MAKHRVMTRDQLEARRLKAIRALQEGLSRAEVAEMLGTTHTSVSKWALRFQTGGSQSLLARPLGRPRNGGLARHGGADAAEILASMLPEQTGLSEALWTWRSVQALMCEQFGLELSRWTIARYVAQWGFQSFNLNSIAARAASIATRVNARPHETRVCVSAKVSPGTGIESHSPAKPTILWAISGRRESAFMSCRNRGATEAMAEFLDKLLDSDPRVRIIAGDQELFQSAAVDRWVRRNGAQRVRPSGIQSPKISVIRVDE